MLGITIGVAAVIIIMSLGAGAQALILNEIKAMGTNKISIMPGKADSSGAPAAAMGVTITTLKYEDAEAIKDSGQIPHITGVVAYNTSTENSSWRGNSYITTIYGVSGDYLEVDGGEVAKGRFFSNSEGKSSVKVAVLGNVVSEELFGANDPIGQTIKIRKTVFEVIGVMKKRGTVAFQNYDDLIIIPNKTLRKNILGIDYLNVIRVAVDKEENIPETSEALNYFLRQRHDIGDQSGDSDDFDIRNSADAMEIIETFTNALKLFLAAMAAMSLVVGGIGIMNIMLMRVNERTREIGLRKAIGASNIKITWQFLIETAAITLFGGIIGVGLGIFISFIVSVVIKNLGYSWDFIVSLLSVFISLFVSALIGLIFGLYPARKAAKMEPVEALRYE